MTLNVTEHISYNSILICASLYENAQILDWFWLWNRLRIPYKSDKAIESWNVSFHAKNNFMPLIQFRSIESHSQWRLKPLLQTDGLNKYHSLLRIRRLDIQYDDLFKSNIRIWNIKNDIFVSSHIWKIYNSYLISC